MKDFYTKITEFKRSKGVTNEQLGSIIGKKEPAFRIALKRKSLSDLEIEKLEHYFDNTEIKKDDHLEDKNKIIALLEENKSLSKKIDNLTEVILANSLCIDELKDMCEIYFNKVK